MKRLATALCQSDIISQVTPKVAATVAFFMLNDLNKYQVPTYFVDPNLLQAAMDTDPADMSWDDVTYPFPAGVFALPKGNGLLNENGTEMEFLGWCYTPPGKIRFKNIFINNENQRISTWAVCPNTLDLYYVTIPSSMKLKVEADDINQKTLDSIETAKVQGNDYFTLDTSMEMAKLNSKISCTIANLLLIAQNVPRLVAQGTPTRIERKHQTPLELWTPRFLGKGYQRNYVKSGVHTGMHVRPHWRREHLHTQVYGPRNSLRKIRKQEILWIDYSD
jgi:hypothetical protein